MCSEPVLRVIKQTSQTPLRAFGTADQYAYACAHVVAHGDATCLVNTLEHETLLVHDVVDVVVDRA